jgi:hypothetical protein
VDEEAHEMFTMGAEMMALPMDEKMKFEQGDDGMTFGFVTFNSHKNSFDLFRVIS